MAYVVKRLKIASKANTVVLKLVYLFITRNPAAPISIIAVVIALLNI